MLLMVNVDDVPGESVPKTIDGLMKQGAGSVHVIPALTKKGRPEYIFLVDVTPEKAEALAGYMALELGTIGVRLLETSHLYFESRIVRVKVELLCGHENREVEVRVKQRLGKDNEVIGVKADHEDLKSLKFFFKRFSPDLSLQAVKTMVEQTALHKCPCSFGDLKMELIEEVSHEESINSIGQRHNSQCT